MSATDYLMQQFARLQAIPDAVALLYGEAVAHECETILAEDKHDVAAALTAVEAILDRENERVDRSSATALHREYCSDIRQLREFFADPAGSIFIFERKQVG